MCEIDSWFFCEEYQSFQTAKSHLQPVKSILINDESGKSQFGKNKGKCCQIETVKLVNLIYSLSYANHICMHIFGAKKN